ncbi:lamin tail domain-containing protein [Candidatus Parcubacteria bacterium]|nr:lamin tail domain-containing protein [Candidatus Parcubacteria bacterium]
MRIGNNAALLFFMTAVLCAAPASAGAALVFSEIMYDLPLPGRDEDREWVEVVNCGPDAIAIATGRGSGSWRFNEGTNRILNAPVQGSATLNPNDVLVLVSDAPTFLAEHPVVLGTVMDTVMNLKNASSTLRLTDGSGTVVATTAYDSSMGASENGKTLERVDPCGNPAGPWQESAADGGTPGVVAAMAPPLPPPSPPPAPEPTPPPAPSSGSGSSGAQPPTKPLPRVALSEFLPDPVGDDAEGEWIEIMNLENKGADISGLMLDDSSAGGVYMFPDKAIIAPSGYLTVPRTVSKIALTNTGDEVKFMWPSGEFIETVTFGKAPEGAAYAKEAGGSWRWTYQPTPAAANVFAEKQVAPKTQVLPNTPPLPQQPPDTEAEYEGRAEAIPSATPPLPPPPIAKSQSTLASPSPERAGQTAVANPDETTPNPTSSATTSQLLAAALPGQPSNIPPWLLGTSILAGGALVGGLVSRFLLRG